MLNLYHHKDSIVHRAPFLLKAFLVSLFVTIVYLSQSLLILCIMLVLCLCFYFLARISLLQFLQVIRIFLPILIIITLVNIFTGNKDVLFYVIRLIFAIGLSHLLSISTPMEKIINESKILFYPLRFIGVSPSVPALLISVVLRSVPLLLLDMNILQKSYALRGGKKHQSFRLIIPLLFRTLFQGDAYAYAITLRGFRITM